MNSSERPISPFLRPIRKIVRQLIHLRYKLFLRGKLRELGRESYIARGALLQPPEFLQIGDYVSIGPSFFLQTNLVVGEGSLISAHVSCVGHDHDFSEKGVLVSQGRRLPCCTVTLEGDNLIGFGVVIVGNVRIGRGAVVGAGSVVTRDLEPYTIYAGVPARPLRKRFGNE